MKKKYVIFSRFNSDMALNRGFKTDSLSKNWIEHRLEIFNKYTRISIENQTNQDFLAVLTIAPESEELIKEVLANYPPLPSNIVFTANKNEVIEAYIKEVETVYIAHIDSDDMYAPEFIEKLHVYEVKEFTGALICQQGYVLKDDDLSMAYYSNKGPSIFVEIFKVRDYLDLYQYYPTIGHTSITLVQHEILEGRNFIITLHGTNTWQQFGTQYNKFMITDEQQKQEILKHFKLINES